jgi:hypothetical protein
MCNTFNNKENTKEINKRYYCIKCADIREEEKAKHKDGWEELFEYICDLYKINTLTGMMFKQIKEFRDIYGYTNKGIFLTLKYYYEVLENEVKDDTGLGIVVYYYEKAKQHYIAIRDVKKHIQNFELDEQLKIVKIKNIDIKDFEKKKQLSFDNIDWTESE